MDDLIESENEQLQPPKRLAELVGEEVARQRLQQEEEAAYSPTVDDAAFDPANPGMTMAKRISSRIQQRRFEQ